MNAQRGLMEGSAADPVRRSSHLHGISSECAALWARRSVCV